MTAAKPGGRRKEPTPGEISAYLRGHDVGFRHGLEKAIEVIRGWIPPPLPVLSPPLRKGKRA